jgi:hypothetical protein
MPNEKGNRYAIHALKDRRATMTGEIVHIKEGIAYREEQLSHQHLGWMVAISRCENTPASKLALDFLPRPTTMTSRQHFRYPSSP